MVNILIVDDEKAARFGMKRALIKSKYSIIEADDGYKALEIIKNREIDIVLLDLNMPKLNGMEVLSKIQQLNNPPLVIVVTAYGSEKIAVEAMKKGAYDYISKPYELDELRLIIKHAIERISLKRENIRLQQQIKLRESFGEIIGESLPMKKIFSLIEKVADTDITVLICGPSGTGKELVAREIHKRSRRANKPFIAVNCAALPENLIESELFGYEKGAFTGATEPKKGKLEEANGGTVFLDEIGDMSISTQAKMLRVLQEKSFERVGGNKKIEVDVRFIAATNKDLEQEIEAGNFRDDLYYRINVLDIYLPPLKERSSDIPLLTKRFIEMFSCKYNKDIKGITPSALQKMIEYNWPGNVRQLKNVIEKAVLLSTNEYITEEDLPKEILRYHHKNMEFISFNELENMSFKEAKKAYVRDFEKRFIIQRLKLHKGNITQTAKSLDMPRQSLQQKIKELGINPKELLENNSTH